MGRLLACVVLLVTFGGAAAAESLTELMAAARTIGRRVAFENPYVRVHITALEYPRAPQRVADERPVVLYVRLGADQGFAKTRLLESPRDARPSWRPGVVPMAVWVELLTSPPRPPSLGNPNSYPPRDAIEERDGWGGGSLFVATFRPFDYVVGLGPLPTVAVFLSDGVVETSTNGLRQRMAVQAGDTYWFEPRTRLTVIDDYVVGVAFLQIPTR